MTLAMGGGNGIVVCGEDDCGLIFMRDPVTTQVYDHQYVADRYDRYPQNDRMSSLRATLLETLLLLHDSLPQGHTMTKKGPLLDVGYGNGSFIRECQNRGWSAFGNDVNPTRYRGVHQVTLPTETLPESNRYRVITFFDALEHFERLDEVSKVSQNTDWIVCSYPRPPVGWPYSGKPWKHYRPGEHHFFFTPPSLVRLFSNRRYAAELMYVGNPEDWIRGKGEHGEPNIETVALKMIKRPGCCAAEPLDA